MRAIKVVLAILLAVTTVLYVASGIFARVSGRDEGPVIRCPEEILEVSVFDGEEALLAGVTAEDAQDGDLTGEVIVGGVSRLISGNTAKVTCMVFDSDDNMATLEREIRYLDYSRPVIRVSQPLIYGNTNDAKLLERVTAEDILDGDLTEKVRVSALWATEDKRVYSATVMVTNSMGDTASVELPVIILPNGRSSIQLRQQVVYVEQGSGFDPADYLVVGQSGLQIRSEVDTEEPGCYWVWYSDGSAADGDLAILTVVVE